MDEWSGVDTPQTVMTTRAPAVLKSFCLFITLFITLLTERITALWAAYGQAIFKVKLLQRHMIILSLLLKLPFFSMFAPALVLRNDKIEFETKLLIDES